MKLYLRNYLLLILLSFLTIFSCTESSGTTDSNNPSTTSPATSLSIDYEVSGDFYIALANTAVRLDQKGNLGSQSIFSISPSFTNGLFLDATNGNIRGTPTIESLPTPYIITANVGGKIYRKAIFLGVVPSFLWIRPVSSNRLSVYTVGDVTQQGGFTWGSSDESLVTVNEDGMISFNTGGTGGSSVIVYAKKGSYSNGISVSLNDYLGVGKSISIGTFTYLTINSGTQTITNKQFRDKGLTGVVLPNSLKTIGPQAFQDNQLTSVLIPNSVTNIANSAFFNNQLTSVLIPNSVRIIGAQAFFSNPLTNVVIPDTVIIIGSQAFLKNKLISVLIPNSVKSIGERAFGKNQLTSVVIPDSVTNIGDNAFGDNLDLRDVSLKQSLYDSLGSRRTTIFGSQFINYIKRL